MSSPDLIINGDAFRYNSFDQRVGKAFRFTEEDLHYNREGQLSLNQVRALQSRRDREVIIWGGFGVLLIGLFMGFVPQIYPDVSDAPPSVQIIFGVSPVWMLVKAILSWRSYSMEIDSPQVNIVVAIPVIERASRSFEFCAGSESWVIYPHQYQVLKALSAGFDVQGSFPLDQYVAVYYSLQSKHLLSLEPLQQV